ncbi:MAG: thylakoid membrane photosystem I accumulation factor [Cyanobium sp.]
MLITLAIALTGLPAASLASLSNDHYDGNIFALYAGNGSLVPPRSTLAQALADHRVAVLVYYLDDSSVSKRFAPTVSELQRLWGNQVELMPLVTDPLQERPDAGPSDPAHYWKGEIPQVVVLDGAGRVRFDRSGQVNVDAISAALSEVTGIPLRQGAAPSGSLSFNELNSEVVNLP